MYFLPRPAFAAALVRRAVVEVGVDSGSGQISAV